MKLLFVCNNMHVGGVQKSLVNLLSEIAGRHDVTLYLFYPEGEFMPDVPESVKIVSGNAFTGIMGMSQGEARSRGIFTTLHRSLWAILTKLFGIGFSFGVLTRFQKLGDEYDAAISFMQNSAFKMFYGGCNEFVANSVKAKKKISFVHCDFKNYFGNNEYNRGYYRHFDKIACVSDSVKERFDGVCPEYKDRSVSVHNCYDLADMRKKSGAYEAEYTEGVLNLFTAARISEEKGIFRMLPILAALKNEGKRFVWRVAGAGPMMNDALAESERLGLGDCVKFLGMLDNPYPYFAKSDLLLVPSFDEAAPMVFGEAEFFKLPILTTDTTSARELVEDRGLGTVCKNDDKAIRDALGAILDDPSVIRGKAAEGEMTNMTALSEFEALIK